MESNLVNHEAVGPGGQINEEKWHESYATVNGRDRTHSTLTNILETHPELSAMDIADVGKKKGKRKPARKAHGREEECTCCWQCSYCFKKLVKFSKSHLTSKICKDAQLALIPNAMVRAHVLDHKHFTSLRCSSVDMHATALTICGL
jgi:iron only hydrogenase large subunit-like protein